MEWVYDKEKVGESYFTIGEASRGGNKLARKTLKFWPIHKMGCIYRAVFEND